MAAVHEGFVQRWPEEILYGLLYVVLPLSPLIFPSLWLVVNYIILARVLSVFHKFKRKKVRLEIQENDNYNNLIAKIRNSVRPSCLLYIAVQA